MTAATRGAMAVIDGNVMAINPGEEAKMQMFIWNNIFFSLGFDVRDHYKELGGDAAAFVAPVSTKSLKVVDFSYNQTCYHFKNIFILKITFIYPEYDLHKLLVFRQYFSFICFSKC